MRKLTLFTLFWLCCTTSIRAESVPDSFLTYADGGHYLGGLSEGRRHGEGAYLYPDYSLYIGEWQAGRKHGHGLFKWPNGNIYEGQWQHGTIHGTGVLTFADGGIFRGRWVNGEPREDADGPAGSPDSRGLPAGAGEERCRQLQEIQATLREFSARLEARSSGPDAGERATVQTWGIDEPCR